MNVAILWNVALFNLVNIGRRFRVAYCIRRQGELDTSVNIYETALRSISEDSSLYTVVAFAFRT
jgi:hypothetical protein